MMMSDIKWAFWPEWNSPMTRQDFIWNNIALFGICILVASVGAVLLAISGDSPTMLALAIMTGVLGGFYTLLLSICWLNNRLRDGGVSSEGWRIVIIILSLLVGFVGVVAFIYSLVKPTEDPAELTVEDDNECRDEGPR